MNNIGVICEFDMFCGLARKDDIGHGMNVCGGWHKYVDYNEADKTKYIKVIEVPQNRLDMYMENK